MLPTFLHKYFWDTDAKKLDIKKNEPYIIERILEYGDERTVRWMMDKYERQMIARVLKTSPVLSRKSANFWALILKVPKSHVLCLSKQFYARARAKNNIGIWSPWEHRTCTPVGYN